MTWSRWIRLRASFSYKAVLCFLHNPPSLWIFRGEDLQGNGKKLGIGRSPRKPEFLEARVDPLNAENVYTRLRAMIVAAGYQPHTLEEHARHMSGLYYINHHARTLFSPLCGRQDTSRAIGEVENQPYSHIEDGKRVRESVGITQKRRNAFMVHLTKNKGMTTEGNRTETALDVGDIDILRVFLLARRDSGNPWIFERPHNPSTEVIESFELVGYWEISADELEARNVLGRLKSLSLYPKDEFCEIAGWRKPDRPCALQWTRDFFHSVL